MIKILHPVFTVCTTKTERTSVTLKNIVYIDISGCRLPTEKVKNIYILALLEFKTLSANSLQTPTYSCSFEAMFL